MADFTEICSRKGKHSREMEEIVRLNDWEIGRFLKLVIALQLAVLGMIGLVALSLDIPVLRQLIGFVYLTFIPGALILRILKLHKMGTIQSLLYTVGLSLTFLMFIGLIINLLYPHIGISKPISAASLIITVTIAILVMCALAYWRDKNFSSPIRSAAEKISLPSLFLLILLPILSFLGARLSDIYENNIVLLLLLALITVIVVLIAFDKFIPRRMYPLAILTISIALLTHTGSLSPYLYGSDILIEHNLYKLVEVNSYWDLNMIASPSNAMLSVTILPAIYHYLSGISSMYIFKIVYPLIFSLVPLGLYQLYRQQTEEKTAFLSTFFFMSFAAFFGILLVLSKQLIGELLVVCLMLLILNKDINIVKRSALLIIFSTSLVVTHYALTYIYIALLVLSWFIVYFMKKGKGSKLTGMYVSLFIVIAFSWYAYTAQSVTFNVIVNMGNDVYTGIRTFMSALEATQASVLTAIGVSSMPSVVHEIARVVFWFTNLFIAVGVGGLFFKKFREIKIEPIYIALSLASLGLMFMAIVLPYFVVAINANRFYHIMLIPLSPFCILGGETVFRGIGRLFKLGLPRLRLLTTLSVSIVLILYFLFNTGFIYEVAGDLYPTSIPLSMKRIEQSEDMKQRSPLYTTYIRQQSVLGVEWLSNSADSKERVYADYWRRDFVESYGAYPLYQVLTLNSHTKLEEEAYVYLGYGNVVGGLVDRWDMPDIDVCSSEVLVPLLEKGNLVYSNGGSEIYKFME